MNRRKFIKKSTSGLLLGGLSSFPWASLDHEDVDKLTILYTNDTHSRLDPFPEDGSRLGGFGGVSRRMTAIERIREEVEHVLLLDAGDVFQGTPYFNFYEGEVEIKAMSKMGYDAATMGNHDFDGGLEGFHKQLAHANFPFVVSNYDFSNTLLAGKIKPYHILQRGNLKIGIIGLGIELEGLVPKNLYGETQYLDPLIHANAQALFLKEEMQCDWIICLSHLGHQYQNNRISDLRLAPQTQNINLIIGGHTHTFLENPVVVQNKSNQKVIIAQSGYGGALMGRMDVLFSVIDKSHQFSIKRVSY
jgi:5'-nucleotidase